MYLNSFNLNQNATIKRRTVANDGFGTMTATTATIGTVKCAIWLNSGNRSKQSDRLTYTGSHTLACAPSTKYLATDYVVNIGTTYKALYVDNVSAEGEILFIGMEMSDQGVRDA
jgi:hypothetical protein